MVRSITTPVYPEDAEVDLFMDRYIVCRITGTAVTFIYSSIHKLELLMIQFGVGGNHIHLVSQLTIQLYNNNTYTLIIADKTSHLMN